MAKLKKLPEDKHAPNLGVKTADSGNPAITITVGDCELVLGYIYNGILELTAFSSEQQQMFDDYIKFNNDGMIEVSR